MAESATPPWLFFGILLGFGAIVVVWIMRPLIIAVTDRSVVVFRAGRFRPSRPKELLARLPRQTRLGPAQGRLWGKLHVAGQRMWIHRRFFKQVAAADAPLLAPPPGAPASPPAAGSFGTYDVLPGRGTGDVPAPPAGAAPAGTWTGGTWTGGATPAPDDDPLAGLWDPDPPTGGPGPALPAGGGFGRPPGGYGPQPGGYAPPGPSAPLARGTWPLDSRRGRPWQWVLAGVAGTLSLALAVAVAAQNGESAAQDRLRAYVDGTKRHSFVAADGRFRAEFPGEPHRQTESEDIGDLTLETVLYQRDVGLDASFLVSFVDLPGPPPDVTGALNGAANAVAVGLDGEIVKSTQTELAGRPAVEFLVKSRLEGGTTDVHYGKLVLTVDGIRLYSIGVIGKDNPPDGYDAFLASFAIDQ